MSGVAQSAVEKKNASAQSSSKKGYLPINEVDSLVLERSSTLRKDPQEEKKVVLEITKKAAFIPPLEGARQVSSARN
ncbi:hypothetical protein BIW11_03562 [Tropilaelaps mercedesae]|uniref:Uncharacterized protein n=1 Tax=Tropilaelaps mercedesae TaxID=418985 RepID=A0A1V9XJ36_9ACAR|nr:hypothetical protein BIW11_03562 [Tropilaelaps mercedesae]